MSSKTKPQPRTLVYLQLSESDIALLDEYANKIKAIMCIPVPENAECSELLAVANEKLRAAGTINPFGETPERKAHMRFCLQQARSALIADPPEVQKATRWISALLNHQRVVNFDDIAESGDVTEARI